MSDLFETENVDLEYPDLLRKCVNHNHNHMLSSRYGCNHEDGAIKAYQAEMEGTHVNFKLTRCGFFINEQYPFFMPHLTS